MSRCFPFPPPGYVVNGIRDEAMIDSIKGAEEKCNKELRRQERKKRDKKEKKDKKDKKRKERGSGEGESEKHSHKRQRKEEVAKDVVQKNQKVDDVFRKLKESEISCLDKSSVTVERELLQSTSQNSCDSTLNSNEKEKKQTLNGGRHNNNNGSTLNSNALPKDKEKQPLDGRHNNINNNNDSESIIRIRLPIRRPKDPEGMMMMITNKDQPCPSRELKFDSVTRDQPQPPCSTSAPQHASKPHEEKIKHHTSTRKHKEKHREKKHKEKKLPSTTAQETYQPSSLCRLCPPSMAEQFLNVVENWVPNTTESRVELTSPEEDECWWLMKKPSSNKTDTERCKQLLGRNNETKEVINTSIAWPHARLLPEADVYALPYTVPF